MKTIAVVEREYGTRLEVAGGPDSPLFNLTTRAARDVGGNEYDAAAAFMAADTSLRIQAGQSPRIDLALMLARTNQRLPLMRQPGWVAETTERAFADVGLS